MVLDPNNFDNEYKPEPSEQPWIAPRGPVTRIVSWIILIAMALVILGALYAVFAT